MSGRRLRACMVGIMVSSPTIAFASGRLPVLPTSESFPSDAACLAALQDVAAGDRRQVAPKTVKADGGTQEVSLDTSGVEHTGARTARYDATLWWHNGIPRTDGSQFEVSHNYRHRLSECDGRVLRTTGEDGYTMSTFAPANSSAAPR